MQKCGSFCEICGRIGRSAEAKQLDEHAVRLAVIAHIRHAETTYDELLASGSDRWEARQNVEGTVAQILRAWKDAQFRNKSF